MQSLVGCELHKIEVSHGEEVIRFETDKGVKTFLAEGDCCSESWFADILISQDFKGGRVFKVEEMDLPEFVKSLINKDGRGRQDEDEVYGYKLFLRSDNTYRCSFIEIIFRNSSNGYYGGMVRELEGEIPKYVTVTGWTEITKTWQA